MSLCHGTSLVWLKTARALLPVLFACLATPVMADESRWFPTQAEPRALIRTVAEHRLPQPRLAYLMMVQSVAGLAAKAVNERRGDEMVWIDTGNADVESWFAGLRRDRPRLVISGVSEPWDLVHRFHRKGIIKGYILYRLDRSPGALNEHRPEMDCSVNVATSLAGLLDGILIDEGLEPQARQHGLAMLLDVRDKTQAWCFENYKAQFNRRLLCTQDPKKPHVRDLAIAHRTLTIYGDEPAAEAMQWLEPLSPIVGWNGGDEFEATRMSTVYGHFQTATDWCMNLPVLMARSEEAVLARANEFDPRTIDWTDSRSAVSFVCSDGDNVQWLETSFFGNESFWANPDRGRIPFGWSCCFTHLSQLCPPAVNHAATTQSANDSWLEWGGGYYYPDLFGLERRDRWDLLARHARRTWNLMQKTNTCIIGFNVRKPGSADALRAYEVFARETEGLLAIFVFQYAPYEGGAGETFWVRDRDGIEIPSSRHVTRFGRTQMSARAAELRPESLGRSATRRRALRRMSRATTGLSRTPGRTSAGHPGMTKMTRTSRSQTLRNVVACAATRLWSGVPSDYPRTSVLFARRSLRGEFE